MDKGFIASFISKQSQTKSEASITEHSHVSVSLFQLCLIITKTLQILLKFYMHIKAKTLHFLYAKKLKIVQNQEKSLWCILNQGLVRWKIYEPYIYCKNLLLLGTRSQLKPPDVIYIYQFFLYYKLHTCVQVGNIIFRCKKYQ